MNGKTDTPIREILSYLIFGVLTVVVNILSFELLSIIFVYLVCWRPTRLHFLLQFFAYWTNSTFVFRVQHIWKNFLQFVDMRIGTLLIDNDGMYLMLPLAANDFFAKCIANVVIIMLNYVASKWIIFRKKDKKGDVGQ